jgi:methylthioribose-1-phosphate isomerase
MVLDRKGGAYSFDAWFKMTPPGVEIYNPAFDITPAEYITAFITEIGVVRPQPDYELALGVSCMGSGGVHELGLDLGD